MIYCAKGKVDVRVMCKMLFHSTYLPTYLPTYSPTNLPTYPPTYVPIDPPTYLPNYPPIHPPTYLTTHPSTHLPTYLPIPVASTWSIGHPWNASFHFSFLTLDSRQDPLDGGSARHKAALHRTQT
jgi:hypothetical protein